VEVHSWQAFIVVAKILDLIRWPGKNQWGSASLPDHADETVDLLAYGTLARHWKQGRISAIQAQKKAFWGHSMGDPFILFTRPEAHEHRLRAGWVNV